MNKQLVFVSALLVLVTIGFGGCVAIPVGGYPQQQPQQIRRRVHMECPVGARDDSQCSRVVEQETVQGNGAAPMYYGGAPAVRPCGYGVGPCVPPVGFMPIAPGVGFNLRLNLGGGGHGGGHHGGWR